jgi:hypothetical protein
MSKRHWEDKYAYLVGSDTSEEDPGKSSIWDAASKAKNKQKWQDYVNQSVKFTYLHSLKSTHIESATAESKLQDFNLKRAVKVGQNGAAD